MFSSDMIMKQGFAKFKNRIIAQAIIKSLIFGISAGLLAVFAVLLPLRLNHIAIGAYCYVLIGLGAACVTGLAVYFIIRPDSKKIAKRLDGALNLNEKVQTMVSFDGCEGEMLALQREDTDAVLSAIPKSKIKFKNLWVYLVLPALALGAFVSPFFIPSPTAVTGQDVIDEADIDQYHVLSLNALIDYVKNSETEENAREIITGRLEDLLAYIYDAETETYINRTEEEMITAVLAVMVDVNEAVEDVNTAAEIMAVMSVNEDEAVNKIGTAVGSLLSSSLKLALNQIRASLEGDKSTAVTAAYALAFNIQSSLGSVGDSVAADDALLASLNGFLNDIIYAVGQSATKSDEEFQASLDEAFSVACESIGAQLDAQNVNRTVGTYVLNKLISVFAIPSDRIPVLQGFNDSKNSGNEGDEQEGNDGGGGSGSAVYGSDELVYDPVNRTQVAYGEILSEYNAQMFEKLLASDLPEEIKQYIKEYFNTLYAGNQTDDDGQE